MRVTYRRSAETVPSTSSTTPELTVLVVMSNPPVSGMGSRSETNATCRAMTNVGPLAVEERDARGVEGDGALAGLGGVDQQVDDGLFKQGSVHSQTDRVATFQLQGNLLFFGFVPACFNGFDQNRLQLLIFED
ncbi:MAG: hypothetical protein HC828_20500, partial [Blastochloris sp.]|nr:hypothetical protein [Blastochloris sp.]